MAHNKLKMVPNVVFAIMFPDYLDVRFCESNFHFTSLSILSYFHKSSPTARNIHPCLSHTQKITKDEHGLGFGLNLTL